MDYTKTNLNKLLVGKYNKDGKALQADKYFNIYQAYEFLKDYFKLNSEWLEQSEYDKIIKNIQDVLNV